MHALEIDAAIRARIQELSDYNDSEARYSEMDDELNQLLTNHMPTIADQYWWKLTVDAVTTICNTPGGGCDGRPGRLYDISDAEILEAQVWFSKNPGWEDMLWAAPVGEYPKWSPGQLIKLKHELSGAEYVVPVAAYSYFSAAFCN